ncbi:hypothetical protein EVAR_5642_1 [Eumeta japonica]|uniref:Uncharacterized protein n=1 Tax=Eumeta variegata TaxID=151549 RepID=A0A4C1TA80_EUMVA|nr:hypothetical protein EVAR_5642_1 [Eumeta japonica]
MIRPAVFGLLSKNCASQQKVGVCVLKGGVARRDAGQAPAPVRGGDGDSRKHGPSSRFPTCFDLNNRCQPVVS